MEVRNGYKKTEVGVIPEDWHLKRLSEVTTLMTNGFVGVATTHYSNNDSDILYIQGYNVEENGYNFRGIKYVTKAFHKLHQKSCLQENDLLTIQTGDVGLTTIVPKELVGSNCHALIITRFKKEDIFPKFYSYYFNSQRGRARLKEIETGTTMKHINVGDLLEFEIPLPPTKSEQTAIANALSDADALITGLIKLIEKKRAIKQGVMQELLRPKEGWEVKKLGDYSKITSGESPSKFNFKSTGIPYFKVEQLNNCEKYQIETPYYIETGNIIPKGSILFPKRGASILLNKVRILVEDSYMDTNLMTLTLAEDLSSEFVYYVLIHIELWRIADTTSIPQINNKHINSIEIFFPSYEEQTRIATILSDIDAEITVFEQKLSKYKMIKQGMMQELLTGRVRLVDV